eukprot:TRINITY_DN16288_c0_g1_i1.p1 TRINITY_DN16288_c0_g1~~TRINITY_DN16288_c0_g1_i1.p1  ORF type:complete len:218 (+),score=118.69 TRINITY_DN16288_c0_g1_i1:77-655(+)
MSGERGGGGGNREWVRRCFDEIKEEGLGLGDRKDYFKVRGTISYIRKDPERPPWYTACPSENCMKKVIKDNNEQYWCESCRKNFPNYKPRYILSFIACDATGMSWLSGFSNVAETIMETKAETLREMIDNHMMEEYAQSFEKPQFRQFVFKCMAQSSIVNDETRLRVRALGAEPVNFVEESKRLLEEIESYN